MVVVDTTVWIDYFRGSVTRETEWLDRELQRQRLGLTDLILCEVLQGIRSPRAFAQVRRDLLMFEVIESGGIETAVAAAQNYQSLRRQGYTIRKTLDCLIATVCLRKRLKLLHRDRDFDPFEKLLGLEVVQV